LTTETTTSLENQIEVQNKNKRLVYVIIFEEVYNINFDIFKKTLLNKPTISLKLINFIE